MTEIRTIPIHPTNTLDEPDFYAEANCRGSEAHQRIIELEANREQIPKEVLKAARALCQTCVVLPECRDYGLRVPDEYGMYGGQTQGARQQLAELYDVKQIKRPITRGRDTNSIRRRDG